MKAQNTKSKKVLKPVVSKVIHQKEPEYMVQLSDPKSLRKELLECLREVIIFMQGYEKFRKIQEEKVSMFHALRQEVKILQNLIDHKLRRSLPKGKLHSVLPKAAVQKQDEMEVVEEEVKMPVVVEAEEAKEETHPANELEELESQLKEIEEQLKKMD
ncbi:hypothetical protein J4437_05420 [Candidatus Woesearchaeota archaeon]|nr:hypothetical protein [Candidatus Woesearchaeota archaeon]